jgi:cytochrome c biogenesis protein ResB
LNYSGSVAPSFSNRVKRDATSCSVPYRTAPYNSFRTQKGEQNRNDAERRRTVRFGEPQKAQKVQKAQKGQKAQKRRKAQKADLGRFGPIFTHFHDPLRPGSTGG